MQPRPMPAVELEKRINCLVHIYYEVEMFIDLVSLSVEDHLPISNAILESWLIHVRNLNEFLMSKAVNEQAKDDVKATHFGILDAAPFLTNVQTRRINKQLAHLTYQRCDSAIDKQWNRVSVYSNAWPVIRSVLAQLHSWIELNSRGFYMAALFTALMNRGDATFNLCSELGHFEHI